MTRAPFVYHHRSRPRWSVWVTIDGEESLVIRHHEKPNDEAEAIALARWWMKAIRRPAPADATFRVERGAPTTVTLTSSPRRRT